MVSSITSGDNASNEEYSSLTLINSVVEAYLSIKGFNLIADSGFDKISPIVLFSS